MAKQTIQGVFLGNGIHMPTETASARASRSGSPKPTPGQPASLHHVTQPVQRFGGDGSFEIDPSQVGLARSGGRPLPQALLTKMEAAFGADFSAVRVHVGPQAARIGAIAFTTGNDLYFAPGRFQPESIHGQQLIGHELAHVVQQRQGRVRAPGSGVAVVQDHALEAEADRLGQRAAMHRLPVQAKMAHPSRTKPEINISTAHGIGSSGYRLTAGARGNPIGSLIVHTKRGAAAEVTDLGVDAPYRDQGIGRQLLVSAARAGQRSGNSKLSLSAQDNGSGRLTRWYTDMGFVRTGVDSLGRARLEAPIGRLLFGAVQPKRDRTMPTAIQRAAAPKKKQKAAKVVLNIAGTPYPGSSSGQYGHAEMDALYDFINAKGSIAAAVTAIGRARVKTVQCHNQPVCGSCKLVLEALGFKAADEDTVLSTEKSGGVSWGASAKVKDFLEEMGFKAVYDQALKDGAK